MKHYYKRNLPHFIVDGYAYFITARLVNTIPKNVILKLKKKYNADLDKISAIENKKEKSAEYAKLKWNYFTEFDSYLDKSPANNWFKNNSIAQIVKDSLHHRDGKVLELLAYTIMSNHVHLIIKPYFDKISSTSEFNKIYRFVRKTIINYHSCNF